VSAREYVFMLQNCASECVNNRTYRTLQETCDEGAPCSSGQGSEALIGSFHIQALPTNRQKTRTCCCTCSCYKILCCNMPSDKNFLRKRACVRPRFKEHCAGRSSAQRAPFERQESARNERPRVHSISLLGRDHAFFEHQAHLAVRFLADELSPNVACAERKGAVRGDYSFSIPFGAQSCMRFFVPRAIDDSDGAPRCYIQNHHRAR